MCLYSMSPDRMLLSYFVRLAASWVHYTTSCNTQSSAPEDGCDHRLKHVELIGIVNKLLLFHLAGVYIIYFKKHINTISFCNGWKARKGRQFLQKKKNS